MLLAMQVADQGPCLRLSWRRRWWQRVAFFVGIFQTAPEDAGGTATRYRPKAVPTNRPRSADKRCHQPAGHTDGPCRCVPRRRNAHCGTNVPVPMTSIPKTKRRSGHGRPNQRACGREKDVRQRSNCGVSGARPAAQGCRGAAPTRLCWTSRRFPAPLGHVPARRNPLLRQNPLLPSAYSPLR